MVDTHYPDSYIIKTHYNFEDDPGTMTVVRVMKGAGRYTRENFDLSTVALSPKYPTDRLLTQEKCKDLRSLACFLNPEAQAWLENLLRCQEELRQLEEATMADEVEGRPDEDPDNDIQYHIPPVYLTEVRHQ